MERGSDKHSPRLDEALKGETRGLSTGTGQTHAEEWREAEPSGEDEPEVSLSPEAPLYGGVPDGMTGEDVAGRAELARFLDRSVFPAVRQVLIDDAEGNNAPDAILDQLRELAGGRVYANVGEIWTSLGHGVEAHRS